MKGILMNGVVLAGKKYAYNDITKGIVSSSFPLDKFYGGRVTRFGRTSEGLLLCLEKNLEEVIDIFVDFANMDNLKLNTLHAIAKKVKDVVLANTSPDKREAKEVELDIPAEATKKELKDYIMKFAKNVVSD
jgi:hypothetical protein